MWVVSEDLDFSIPFLVTVNRVYHPEVFELLEQFGAKSIEAHKFYMLELTGKGNLNAEIHISGDCYKGILTEDELSCRNKLLNLYGNVLDICANDGFIDLEISSEVNSVLGIEYNEKLVEIAHLAKDILKIDNVDFVCDDYNHWKTVNRRKFDIIFSFAIHIWIGTTPEEYARDIYKMLNNNGVFFFESQTLESDVKYVDYCREFECVGLKKLGRTILRMTA